jgi:O-acetyl-ADP-ribose deacetylase (regulator of RNase III)
MTKLNIIKKDILTLEEGIIVQQVNAIGRTGAGLSGTINAKYPEVRKHYLTAYEDNKLVLGNVLFTTITPWLHFVASIVGQQNVGTYKVQTNFDALEKGFKEIAKFSEHNNLKVWIPYYLGSGLGGGSTQQTKQETWAKVSELIMNILPEATICKLG